MKTIASYTLFIIAINLAILIAFFIFIPSVVIVLIRNQADQYFLKMAIAIDKFGNILIFPIANLILIKRKGYHFGNPDETISYVLGKNKVNDTLLTTGKFIAWVLNKIDKNHVEKAIQYTDY